MFRENVLTNDDIIDRIATTMVPVAVDRWKAEDPNTEEAKFLQPFLKEHPPLGSPCIYSPEGQALGGFNGFGDMVAKTRTLIEDSLRAFGPVETRNVRPMELHPYRGKGVMPDGRVRFAEYVRPSDEAVAFMNTKSPVISSVILAKEEVETLAPPRIIAGETWSVPDDVAKKFSRVTSPMCYQHAPQPDWVTSVGINAEVRTIKDGEAWLRYDGRIASEHRTAARTVSIQETKLTGEGVYDVKSRTMQSVLLVGEGTLRWPADPEKLVPFDVLVEWSLK